MRGAMKSEKGTILIEVIASLALLGLIGVAFLNGLAATSTARNTADERVSAKILAETHMENLRKSDYDSSYNLTIPSEYEGYSANLTVVSLRNTHIQRLTVTIQHHNHEVLKLESYKMRRTE